MNKYFDILEENRYSNESELESKGSLFRDLLGEYSEYIIGNKSVKEPSKVLFQNSIKGIEILDKHIRNKSKIVVHCDVDCDGIGSGYQFHKIFKEIGILKNSLFVINREKFHGILLEQIQHLNNMGCELLIVLDSSSNEIQAMKEFNGDIIILDHHICDHSEFEGNTKNGKYIIINSTLKNTNSLGLQHKYLKEIENTELWKADSEMSCGLVVYEFLRLYFHIIKKEQFFYNLLLYQWATLTLFTDIISLKSLRNQYYIDKTINSIEIEEHLHLITREINKYQINLTKSFINFYIAPMINRGIRAGCTSEVLDIVLNRPKDILNLQRFKEEQDKILENVLYQAEIFETYIKKDITNLDIKPSYCGLIATKLCKEEDKNSVCYRVEEGKAKGSFRGRRKEIDYRKEFEKAGKELDRNIFAQGHKQAFGFEVKEELLKSILNKLESEVSYNNKNYILDFINNNHKDSIEKFKREGNLLYLGMANARLSSEEIIHIIVKKQDIHLINQRGKVYEYECLGLRGISFEEIKSHYVELYVEYTNNINIFFRNSNYGGLYEDRKE